MTNAQESASLKFKEAPIERVDRMPVVFENQDSGLKLAGIVFTPRGMDKSKKHPAVIVAGPMYSVKEQTQSLYAMLLAEKGYVTLVYDNSFIGSSEGHPRGLEDPTVKGSDVRSALTFMQTLPYIDTQRIAAMGICGSGTYVPSGLVNDPRVKAVISIVPFTIMNMITTAEDGVLLAEKEKYETTGEAARLDLIKGSLGEAYYRNPDRGASANYTTAVSWAQIEWHKFTPTEIVKGLHKPYLVITSENSFTRQGSEEMYNNAPGPKEFHLVKEATHFDMYDIEIYVDENMNTVLEFLSKYL